MADNEEMIPPPEPSEYTRDELIKMIDEEERTYFRRLVDMCKGLRQPKETLDYKKAMIEFQRLGAPLVSVVTVTALVVTLCLIKITPDKKEEVAYEVQPIEAEPEEQLEEPPEPPPPPEDPPEPMEDMEITDVTVNIDAPPTTSAVQSPSPAPVDAVAITPSPIRMPGVYASRSTGVRGAKIGAWGLGQTEALVYGFLRYLKMTQGADGMWRGDQTTTGSTALALLCFLAHGEVPGKSAEFGDTVQKAIQGLLNDQIKTEDEAKRDRPNAPRKGGTHAWRRGEVGYFKGRDQCNYAHFLAVYALSEAYAMTRVPEIKTALELAIPHIIKGQNAQGGWYYNMDASCPIIDTSYASWAVQALKAAKLAHVGNSQEIVTALKKASRGIKELYHPNDGSFGYTTKSPAERKAFNGLTAPCALILQMLEEGDTETCKKAIAYMDKWTPTFNKKAFTDNSSPQYYCYYLSQVRFNLGEGHPAWKRWHQQQQKLYMASAISIKEDKSGYKDHEGKPQYITFWPRANGKHKFVGESAPISDEARLRAMTSSGVRGGFPVEDLINRDACTTEWAGASSDIISSCFTALQLMVYYRNSPLSKGALTSIEAEAEIEVSESGSDEVEIEVDL